MNKIITSIIGTGSHAYTWANAIKKDNNYQLKNVSSRTEVGVVILLNIIIVNLFQMWRIFREIMK